VELAADLGYLGNLKLKWIGNTISGPQDIQAATTGDTRLRWRVQRGDREAEGRERTDQSGGWNEPFPRASTIVEK
jgi:hypothetical protein